MPARIAPSAILAGGAKVEIQSNGSIHMMASNGQPVETHEDRFRITHGPFEMVGLSGVEPSVAGEGRFWYDGATNRWVFSENGGAAVRAFGSTTLTHSDITDWNAAVDARLANVINGAPAALDQLNEIAAAIGNDANYSTTVNNLLAGKFPLAGGTLTGTAGAGFHGFLAQSAAPGAPADGFRLYANATGKLSLIRPDGFTRTFDFGVITGNRTISFPDADITVVGATGAVTANRLARITATGVIGNSLLYDDGTNTTLTSGVFILPTNASTPSIGTGTTTGLGISAGGNLSFYVSNSRVLRVGAGDLNILSGASINWDNSATTIGGAPNTSLFSDAANILALRNGASPQVYRVYNGYTDGNNYERAGFSWSIVANTFYFGTEAAGTGTARDVIFMTGGAGRWRIGGTTGHLLATNDNAFDIGASGATRPRNIYAGTSIRGGDVYAVNTGYLGFANSTIAKAPSDGILRLTNNAETDFSRLQFGGTTASFPAWKRNGASFDARLADDSGYAQVRCASLGVNNRVAATTLGNVTGKVEIFSASGVSLGFMPLYDAIS